MLRVQAVRPRAFQRRQPHRQIFARHTYLFPVIQPFIPRINIGLFPIQRNSIIRAAVPDVDEKITYQLNNFTQLLELRGVQRSGALQDLVDFIDQLPSEQKDEMMPQFQTSGLHRRLIQILKDDHYFLFVDGFQLHKLLFLLSSYGTPDITIKMLEIIEDYEEENQHTDSLLTVALNQLQRDKLQSTDTINALMYIMLFTYTPVGMYRLLKVDAVPVLCRAFCDYLECLVERVNQLENGELQHDGPPEYEDVIRRFFFGIGSLVNIFQSFKFTVLGAYVMMALTELINCSSVQILLNKLDKGIKEGLAEEKEKEKEKEKEQQEQKEKKGGLFNMGSNYSIHNPQLLFLLQFLEHFVIDFL
eukprot:TRINITY_DN19614_c0_g1_i1.p2 TRINITY_DN19614_c0_g1~~TRINITY_DN19614_c0_g1_i1.p2  ORF type:complete len:367 (-),score=35.91 TRINITY_DN19614_c0_g1_i1:1766-2845(-)